MIRPVLMLLTLICRAAMTAQTASLPGRKRPGLQPRGRGNGVGRAGQVFLNALEPLLSLVWLAEPGVGIRHAEHEFAALMRAQVAQIRALDRVCLLVVTQALFD